MNICMHQNSSNFNIIEEMSPNQICKKRFLKSELVDSVLAKSNVNNSFVVTQTQNNDQ